jgi:hypothetical protein
MRKNSKRVLLAALTSPSPIICPACLQTAGAPTLTVSKASSAESTAMVKAWSCPGRGTPINGTVPSWAASPAPVAFFNIPLGKFFNNAEPNPTDFSFTTYLDITMGSPNLGYYFSMQNPTESAGLSAPTKGVNTPLVTTLVNVIHYGATPTAPETWVVTPASISPIGTLMSNLKGGLGEVGQFYLPFSITVTRQ